MEKANVIIIAFLQCLIKCKSEEIIICEGTTRSFQCCNGESINITNAIYGRTQSGEPACSETTLAMLPSTDPCFNAVDINDIECHLQRNCTFTPTNGWIYGMDPCKNIKKYLNVTYTCGQGLTSSCVEYTMTTLEVTQPTGPKDSVTEQTSTYMMPIKSTAKQGGTTSLLSTITASHLTSTEEQIPDGTTVKRDPMSTDQVPLNCQCQCSEIDQNQWGYLYGLTPSEMKVIMKYHLDSLIQNVTIDRKATNRVRRMKMSASDDRNSARFIGFIGLSVIVTVVTLLVAIDICNLFSICIGKP